MRKIKTFVVLAVLTISIGFGQRTVEKTRPQELVEEIGLQNLTPSFSVNPAQIEKIPNHTNSIYISQVGTNNSLKVKTLTQSSAIDMVQEGNNNTLRLNFSAMTATETIRQLGDNHYLAVFGKSPSLNLERTINQNGYGQNLTVHGSNSLSEKIQLNMRGSSSTIIIRNFN